MAELFDDRMRSRSGFQEWSREGIGRVVPEIATPIGPSRAPKRNISVALSICDFHV